MILKTLEELKADGRRVFLRLDLNVPMDDEQQITDETKILQALPTIRTLLDQECRIVLASHLGPASGERKPEYSLEPIAVRLAHLLDTEIILSEDAVGDGPSKMAFALREGQVLMLENLWFYPKELENDDGFAKQLAGMADVYVNDAFSVMHSNHASINGVPRILKDHAIGLLAQKELEGLNRLVTRPTRPFVAFVGGSRVKDKIELLLSLLSRVDRLCLGGALAQTFLVVQGKRLGKTRIEMESLALAEKVLRKAAKLDVEVVLPVDQISVERLEDVEPAQTVRSNAFPEGRIGVDIGPETIDRYLGYIDEASTVFWNGPMGVFEMEPFAEGTARLAKAIARSNAYSVVSGSDTLTALRREGVAPFISHVSTGGNATLRFLEGSPLPGIQALEG